MISEEFLKRIKGLIESHFLINTFFEELPTIENDLFLKGKNAVDELAKENGNFALDVLPIENFGDVYIDYNTAKLTIKNLTIVSNLMEWHFKELINKTSDRYIPNALIHIEVEKLIKDFDFLEFEESEDFNFLMGRFQDFMYFDFVDKFIHNDYKRILFKLKALPPQQTEKPKSELTINQIALKYVYSEIQITRENGNKIAKEYGHNSGEKLFQRFTYYSSASNRKGKPNICTPKKLNNKIELLNSVVELLPTDKQERAKDEVSILKKIYEAEYQ